MEEIVVHGGGRLHGKVHIPGAKNSVLPLMAAAVLSTEAVMLTHVPHLSDVDISIRILRSLGCDVSVAQSDVTVHAAVLTGSTVPPQLMSAMRSSIFFLAPLLVRTGRAEISMPGGCRLGTRPIDIHLAGLEAMGVQIYRAGETLLLEAPEAGLHGTEFTLRLPSVGATETLLMAAAGARGDTILHGVALEPEIEDLISLLAAMGTEIEGRGTSHLRVAGGAKLHGAQGAVCPDRIVAATVLCAVAGCGGEITLEDCAPRHLQAVVPLLRTLGCEVQDAEQTPGATFVHNTAKLQLKSLHACSEGRRNALGKLQTGVYPALPTDVAPLLAAATLRARGESLLHDTIFDNRFACAEGFAALGAQVRREGASLRVCGVPVLQGAMLGAQDLRGGAALVLAALQAQGDSTLTGIENICRGYENIVQLFAQLGAQIEWHTAEKETVRPPQAAFAADASDAEGRYADQRIPCFA